MKELLTKFRFYFRLAFAMALMVMRTRELRRKLMFWVSIGAMLSVFFDAGNAWGPDLSPGGFVNPLQVALASAGAEVTTEFLALFDVQLRLRGGFGVPLVRVAGDGTSVRGWLRVGVPF